MATTPVDFGAPDGLTLTAEVYAAGSDILADSVAATERTNNVGVYRFDVTGPLSGLHDVRIVDASANTIAQYQVGLLDDTLLRRCGTPSRGTNLVVGFLPLPLNLVTDSSSIVTGTEEMSTHTNTHSEDDVLWVLRSDTDDMDIQVDILVPVDFTSRSCRFKTIYAKDNTGTVILQVFNWNTTTFDNLETLTPSVDDESVVTVRLLDSALHTAGGITRLRFLGAGMDDGKDFSCDWIQVQATQEVAEVFPTPGEIADSVWSQDLVVAAPTADTAGDFQVRSALCSGNGGIESTLTIRDNASDPIQDAEVWITSDVLGQNVVAGTKETNVQGEVVFMLDEGLHYRWVQKNGFDFSNPQPFTVV